MMQLRRMKVALLAVVVLAACNTTQTTPKSASLSSAPALTGASGQFSGSYESGNPWSLNVQTDGTALYKDSGSSNGWPAVVRMQSGDLMAQLPENYEWEGIRYPGANLTLSFDQQGGCTKMLYRSHVAFQGDTPFPASCTGKLDRSL